LRTFKYIRNPEGFEAVADETRRRMIYLLRAKEQTVSQLAESLGKTPQAIYHQIKKLLEVGLVEVAREERVDHFIETYYRATAEVFEFHHGELSSGQNEEQIRESLGALAALGFKVTTDRDSLAELVKLNGRMHGVGLQPDLEERIAQLDDVGFLARQGVAKLAQLLTMSDKQFDAMQADERRIRKLLTSGLGKAEEKPRR